MGVGLSLYWWGLRDEPDHQNALLTYLPLAAAGAVVAAAAGFLPREAQPWVYLGAFGLFFAAGEAAQLGTPFHVYPRHFAERHGLILIVALGESIIAVGVGSAELERSAVFLFAALAGVAAACVVWWAYFDWFQEALQESLAARPPHARAALARDLYAFAHLPVVFGIVCLAVAAEGVIAHPKDHLDAIGRFGLAAGSVLYLLGMAAAHLRATRQLLTERVAAAGLAAGTVVALRDAPALSVIAAVTVIVIAALAVEHFRRGGRTAPAA
jgi:low temperature requirement protein LtrA